MDLSIESVIILFTVIIDFIMIFLLYENYLK